MLGCGLNPWVLQEIDLRGPGHRQRIQTWGKLAEPVPGAARPALTLGCPPPGPTAGGAASGRTWSLEKKAWERPRSGPASLSPSQASLSSPEHHGTPRSGLRVQAFGSLFAPNRALGWGGN